MSPARRAAPAALLLLLPLVPGARAQERMTENTLKLAKGQASPPTTLADMAWLAGHWTGDGLGGRSEEMWSPPAAGAMMGMYRHVKDGKPVFYELLTLVEEGGSLVLRLKHFNPDLSGWEEKGDSVSFAFVGTRDGVLHFEGMAWKRNGEDEVTVFLAIQNKKDGTVREAEFRYTRVKSAGRP